MAFDRNDYLAWYIPRVHGGQTAIDLSASGVRALTPDEIDPPAVDPWQAAHRLEAALAGWLGIPPDQLLFTPGATGGTLLALLTLARRDGEILVEQPTYEPMLRQAERLAEVRRFRRDPERNWQLDLDQLRAQVSDRTALIMLTEPSNPSGTFLDRGTVLEVAEMAAAHDALVLVNEVYRGFTEAPSLHRAADNVVVVSSLSKLLGAYTTRLGWLSADPALIGRLRLAHLNYGMAAAPAATTGLGIVACADELRARALEIAAAGVDTVDRWIATTPGVSWARPQGPGFGCVTLPERIGDDVAFAETLFRDHGVLTVPGRHFELPGRLRLSWLQAGDGLEQGLAAIASML